MRTPGCGCIGHPAFPAPSDCRGRQYLQNSRACDAAEHEGMFVVARDCAALSTVVVRLDRTTQYAGTPGTDLRSRGVLDTRFRGYDSGFWAHALTLSLRANGSAQSAAPDERKSARLEMTGSAKQSSSAYVAKWIASSQGLLAMTGKQLYFMGFISSQALRSVAERDASRRIEATAGPSWFPSDAAGSRECAPDDRLRIVRRRRAMASLVWGWCERAPPHQ
jgi:hypothetical protein